MTTEGDPSGPQRVTAEADPVPRTSDRGSSTGRRAGTEAEPATDLDVLISALTGLRDVVRGARYALNLPSAASADASSRAIVAQLDNYVLPRLGRLDAPLLAVVAGSTGAGKSTLVNSLVRVPVSAAGVLRPTTRSPVLVCNPQDMTWFAESRLLPGLSRTTTASDDPQTLVVMSAPALAPGAALLDAPDIDSVVGANRALADELLAAADLWLFVTSASRYADAVPWGMLRSAKARGTAVALVLDRVPDGAEAEITPHLIQMLTEHGLAGVPLFVIPQSRLDGQGLLDEKVGASLRGWLTRLAGAPETRTAVVRRTVGGAVDAVESSVAALAAAADEQVAAAWALVSAMRSAYRGAEAAVERGIAQGAALRGEVFTRWQELVDTGAVMRAAHGRIGRLRDRTVAAVSRRTDPTERFGQALESSVTALLCSTVIDAAEQVGSEWRSHPAGAALLEAAGVDPAKPSADLPDRVARLVRDWRRGVLDLVETGLGGAERGTSRGAGGDASTVQAAGLLVMVLALAADGPVADAADDPGADPDGDADIVGAGAGDDPGAYPAGDADIVGDMARVARTVLRSVFEPGAVRDAVEDSRRDLLTRLRALVAEESARCQQALDAARVDETAGERLRAAVNTVVIARLRSGLPAARTTPVPLPVTEPTSMPTPDGGPAEAILREERQSTDDGTAPDEETADT